MEKVDELIEKLAIHIIGLIDASNNADCEDEIEEKTRALAELVAAKAQLN